MIKFKTVIQKFDKQGEKTGWTYVAISQDLAQKLNPGVKTTYRVRGLLDDVPIEKLAIMPMGDGSFLMALKAGLRKALGKGKGAELTVQLWVDQSPMEPDADFWECLQAEAPALAAFQALTKGHQNYFSQWITSAKTDATKAKRIAMAVNALAKGWGYPEMIRAEKAARQRMGF